MPQFPGPRQETIDEAEALMDLIRSRQNQGMRNYVGDLADMMGLSDAQIRNRVAVIKDALCGKWQDALGFSISHGYFFADSYIEAQEYTRFRLAIMTKQMKRLYNGTVLPAYDAFGSTKLSRQVKKDAERMIEDLEDFVDELVG